MTAKTYEQQMAVSYLLFLHCVAMVLYFKSIIYRNCREYVYINE